VGGLTTIVRDGETGFLVPWREPSLFAHRIRQLLDEPGLRAAMARHARRSVERFGWDVIADRHLDVYAEVLAQHARPVAAGAEPAH
jgi:glycosyltransferase involved in cell wall biosynthesis